MNLRGVLIPAVTPFDRATGEVDAVAMCSNVGAWLEHPVLGIVIGGSTGEAVFLDESERRVMLEVAREVIPEDRLLVAGTGAESTRATNRLCRVAAESGADAVLVMPPAFYKGAMTPDALALHYRLVADASPVPVILYQVPLRMSTLDLTAGLVAELSAHGNIVGIKDSRPTLDTVGELVEQCQDGFQVLVGSGAHLYGALEVGAAGAILGVANLATGECAGLVTAFRDGRQADAGRLQERVGPVHKAIVSGMGVPGVKVAVDLLGLQGGDPRPPLRPLAANRRGEVRAALEQAGLLHAPATA